MTDIEPVADLPSDVASDVSNGCFGSLLIFLTALLSSGLGIFLTNRSF